MDYWVLSFNINIFNQDYCLVVNESLKYKLKKSISWLILQ